MANGYNQNNKWDPKGNFKHPRSKWAILIVVIVSLVLIGTGILLAYDTANGLGIVDSIFSSDKDLGNGLPTVTSISFDSEAIGMTANLNEVYVKMTYSDGSTRQVALSRLNPDGLDLTVEGKQNISISYGGEEWPLKVNVVSSEITIKYVTSDGGRIVGDVTQVLPAGQNCSTVEAVPNEGWEFVGWSDKVMTAKRQETAVSANMEYRAIFARKTYRVRFKLADGTWYSVPVQYGDNVPLPSEGTYQYQKYGYEFGGWDVDPAKLNDVQQDMDIYGIYNDKNADFHVYVTSETDVHKDGSGEYAGALGLKDLETSQYSHVNGSDNQTCEVSHTPASAPIDRTALLYQGYYAFGSNSQIKVVANPGAVLSKWLVLTASGTWTEIAPTTAKQEVVVLSEGIDPVAFNARVDYSTYTLAFNLNETTSDKVLQVVAVMEYEKNTISFEDASTIIGSLELNYTDHLDINAVTACINPRRATVVVDALGAPVEYMSTGLPMLSKYGYDFAGWYRKNSNIAVTNASTFSEDSIVEARWSVKKFDVVFSDGDSDNLAYDASAEQKELKIDYNSTIGTAFLSVMPVRANYTFVGWFEQGRMDVAVTAATLVLRDMVLVPVFAPREHTLNISIEGQTTLTAQVDSVEDSVYKLQAVFGYRTDDSIIIVGHEYPLYPNATTITNKVGDYLDNVVSLSGAKQYYVDGELGYALSAIDSATLGYNSGAIANVTINGVTYYVNQDGSVSVAVGGYDATNNLLNANGDRYYISTNFTYQLREMSAATMSVDSETNTLTDFRIGDMIYYVNLETGALYLDRYYQSAEVGTYDKTTGIISLNSTDVRYFADIDNRAIYQMSSTRAYLTRVDGELTKIEFSNVTYTIENGVVYEGVGSYDNGLLMLATTPYYVDVDGDCLYSMTAVSLTTTATSMVIDGNTYYVKGTDVLVAVGTKDGDIYNIGDDVYFAVGSGENTEIYLLKDKMATTLNFSEAGDLVSVTFAGGATVDISVDNYVQGILMTSETEEDGTQSKYYIYRGSVDTIDTSEKVIYETNNYVYTFRWEEHYELQSLLINNVEYKDLVHLTATSATIVIRYDASGNMIALTDDIAIAIVLAVKSYDVVITDNDDTNTAKYQITGDIELTGSTSYTVSVNQGETIELDITAPKNMAIASVRINGALESITANSTTFYKRFVNLMAMQTIEVTYTTLEFSINVKDGDTVLATETKKYGESYTLSNDGIGNSLVAPDGMYIEKIVYNGSVVNIYDCAYVDDTTIYVNGLPATARQKAARDARMTSLVFEIAQVNRNVDIEISYAEMYYIVKTAVEGNATLTTEAEKRIKKGGTAAIAIEYQPGYDIVKYSLEKVEEVDGSYIENITTSEDIVTRFVNLSCDLTIVYYVEAIKNNIVFNTDSTVTIETAGESTTFDSVAAFSVNYNQDREFVITAPQGKYIASISEGGKTYALPYKATSFSIFKTAVTEATLIEITLADLVPEDGAASGRLIVATADGGYASVETASGRNESYLSGEAITVRLIPKQGYDVNSLIISRYAESPESVSKASMECKSDGVNVYYVYVLDRSASAGDITFTPVFERQSFDVTLSVLAGDGIGGIYYGATEDSADLKASNATGEVATYTDQANYQDDYKVFFIAEEGSYIYDVRINGVPISFDDFEENRVKTTTNGKYEMGSLTIAITKATTIEVVYAIDVFTASIEAVGINPEEGDVWGTATVDKAEYLAGETINIAMEAGTGWHITALVINGEYVDSSLFLKSLEEDLVKYNTSAKYAHKDIRQNTTILVYYEKNSYVVNYYAYNQSINYSDVDRQYQYYGSAKVLYKGAEIAGAVVADGATETDTTMHKAIYRGIKHGDDVVIEMMSYARNGYEISAINLKLTSGVNIALFDNPTGVRYSYDKMLSKLTIYDIEEDVFAVEVYYTRKTFTISVDFGAIVDAPTVGVGFSFSNAQSDTDPIITKLAANRYQVEYGINYRLIMTPTESYEIEWCRVGGADIAYVTAAGGSVVYLDGSVAGDRAIEIKYRKKTYLVSLAVNAGAEELGTANFYGTTETEKILNYGESIRLDLTPYASKGGYISSFVINGRSIVVNSLEQSGDSYVYDISDVKETTIVQVVFDKQTFNVSYKASQGGTVTLSYRSDPNASWTGKVAWGEDVTVTIDLNEHYELDYYTIGDSYAQYPIDDDMYVDNNRTQIRFTLDSIKEDILINFDFTLKVFAATVSVNNRNYGDVEIYDSKDMSTPLNAGGALTTDIVCTKDLVIRIKPTAGRIVSSATFKMNTLRGTVSTLTPTAVEYDNLHTDYLEYTIKNVTGDLYVNVVYVDKLYTLNIKLVGGEALSAFSHFNIKTGGGTRNETNYAQDVTRLAYNSTIELSLDLKDGYDIDYLTINKRNYYGYINRVTADVNNVNNYLHVFTINDELINTIYDGQLVSGSGTNYTIELVISVMRDTLVSRFELDNVTNIEDTADVLTVSDRIDFIFNTPTTIEAAVKQGYMITEFSLVDKAGNVLVNVLELDSMTTTYEDGKVCAIIGTINIDKVDKIVYTAPDKSSAMSIYTKEVYFVLRFAIKTYAQQSVEYVFDATTSITDAGNEQASVSNTTADYHYFANEGAGVFEKTGTLDHNINVVTAAVAFNTVQAVKNMAIAAIDTASQLSSTLLPYGATITMETSLKDSSGQYRFYGFEEYVNGAWVAVVDGVNNVSYETDRKIKYVVYGERIFRAVYERLYTIEIDALPFHKSTQGTAPNINYVAYTALAVSATDPFSGVASFVDGNTTATDISKSTYQVQFGADLVVRGSDSFTAGSTANRTQGVDFYNVDRTAIANASVIDNFATRLTVDGDYDLVAVFKNKVQIVLSYDSNGGTSKESGGMVTVKNSKGQNLSKKGSEYYSYELQAAYDYVTITIAVNPYYRFDGFYSRVATNRNSTDNIVWDKNDYDTIVTYKDIYKDSNGDLVPNQTDRVVNGDYEVTRDGDVITIKIFVTENCMYRINYVKTFAVDTAFVNGYDKSGNPTYLADQPISLTASGTSIAYKTSSGEYRYDYGSHLTMSHAFDQPDYQFVGWYLGYEEGGAVKHTNLFNLATGTYYDAYSQQHTIFMDDSLAEITDLNDKDRLSLTVEYLPVYNVSIVNGFDYMKDSKGNDIEVAFRYATSETSLTTVMYESIDYVGNTTDINTSLSKIREVRTNVDTEMQEEYDTKSLIRLMTHVIDMERGFSTTLNTIVLKTVVNPSYRFNYWEISFDDVDYVELEGTDNSSTYVFDLVKYVEDNGIAGKTMYFRPNMSKLNEVVVSKVVYYERYGELSTNSAALRDTNVYIGVSGQVAAAGLYGESVTLTATSQANYRFIGWYDKTGMAVNMSDDLIAGMDKEGTLVFDKKGYSKYGTSDYYTDYTYELEARFIRTVTISFGVVNASAGSDSNYAKYAPYINGVDKADGVYIGMDKDGNEDFRNTVSTLADVSGSSDPRLVTMTKDAGTYAVLKLSTESNIDGFDNTCMFRSGFATGGSCYYNDQDDQNKYYTLFFNYDRNITVQYVTYGQVSLTNALANTKIVLGAEIGAVYEEGIKIAAANGIDLSLIGVNANTAELVDPAGKYTIRVKDSGELEISTTAVADIVLPYIKKTDYKNTEMQVSLSQMKSGYILKDFVLRFSYKEYSQTDISIDLIQQDYMPFKSGLGTQSVPYVISKPIHLAAIEAIYTTMSSLADVPREPITINGLTYVTYVTNPNLYSTKGVYFEMDSSYPASKRYMSLGNWQAICREGNGFDATFDGGGWEIGNIVSSPTEDYYGIFGRANGATFTEVDFMGGNDISATGRYIALLVGYAVNTNFYDINVKANNEIFLGDQKQLGTIKTTEEYVGVLAGYMQGCVVENVYLRLVTVVGEGIMQPDLLDSGEPKKDELGNVIYKMVGGDNAGGIAGYAVNTRIGSATTTLTLDNVTIQGGRYLGGIVGQYMSDNGSVYAISNVMFRGNSSSFGTKDQSYDVGGVAGYMGENTSLSNIAMTTSGVQFFVSGHYRKLTEAIVRNRTEEYVYNSAIGGFVGTSYATIDNIQLTQGSITMYGSIAGGFVGANFGTVKNVYIGVSGKVLFNLQYGGYYGGMIGFNKGFVNYARIGSYGTFAGLSSNVSQLITRDTSIDDGANVLFFADGVSDVSGETYDDRNGVVHDEWGFLAMGGVIGANSGKLYNSVTYGKVVSYKRIAPGVTSHDALGGLVGMNYNSEVNNETATDVIQVMSSGTSFGIVINYTVMVSNSIDYVTAYMAVGGVVGHHGEGLMRATYTYHSCVSNFYNIGSPAGQDGGSQAAVYGLVGGIASSLSNYGFGTFYSGWAYYNTTTYAAGDYMFNVKIGDASCEEMATHCAVAYNSATGGSPETIDNWGRGNIFPTNPNYHTYVGRETASIYHVQGKAFSSFASLVHNSTEGEAMPVPNSALFDSGAKLYTTRPDGSLGSLLPNQYNYSPNKTSEWMLG